MKVIITGASGFIGSHLTALMTSLNKYEIFVLTSSETYVNEKVSIFKLDTQDYGRSVKLAFDSISPDVVIHLATNWRSNSNNIFNDFYQPNLVLSTNLLKQSMSKEARFINICSYWQLNLDEFEIRSSDYVKTKDAFRFVVEALMNDFPSKTTNVYLYDNYGPQDFRGKLIPSLIQAVDSKTTLEIRSPNINMNLLHIYDVVDGIINLIDQEFLLPNYEISSSKNMRIWECLREIEILRNYNMQIKWESNESFNEGPNRHKRLYPLPPNWNESISFVQGIRDL